MRLKTVSIQNFRLIADSTIPIPTGLTLVNGENGLGKSSIFQAILWCLYGPDALGDNQTSLVRQGHRDMKVTVKMALDSDINWDVTRQFSLAPNGKSGRTELTIKNYPDLGGVSSLSGDSIAEAQANINKHIGGRDIFMATAYVDQHDGPGAFWRLKPAEQRAHIRDFVNISPDWDTWHDLAKLKHKTGADRIVGNLGRLGAAQELVDQNTGVEDEKAGYTVQVAGLTVKIKKLNLNLEDLQDEQDEVDKVVAENERRISALLSNQIALDLASKYNDNAVHNKAVFTELAANLSALDEERRTWLTATDVWDDRNTEYQVAVADYNGLFEKWNERNEFHIGLFKHYVATDELRVSLSQEIADTDTALRNQPPQSHCPTCEQLLGTAELHDKVNAVRMEVEIAQVQRVNHINDLGESVDVQEIKDTAAAHLETKPLAPVSPGTRPVFESENEWNAAKSAESDIAAVDAEIKTRAEQVKTLEVAREELPAPDDYDTVAYIDRTQTIGKINTEIVVAEVDKRDRERGVTEAETVIRQTNEAKERITELEEIIASDEKLQKTLDIVVTGTGPNGARQLMIDQQLGDFQAEVNKRLNTLLPGVSIYFDTQAESGRETFETLFATPNGVIGWHGLSGAQRVAVGLSTRLALAQMVQARQGHVYSTWLFDEVDGSMRGENREAFVGILNKLREEGIDVLVVSHAGPVIERIDQRIEVRDAGGYTEVR